MALLRVDTKESSETVLRFLERHPFSVPVLLDKTGKVGRLYGIWAHPTSYLIDRRGFVRYRAVGLVDWSGTEPVHVIGQLLKEP